MWLGNKKCNNRNGGIKIKPLSKEEAIRLHKEMWNYVKDNVFDPYSPNSRYMSKVQFIELNHLEPVNQHCFLCEYAMQQYHMSNKPSEFEDGSLYCKYCPAIWGTENIANMFFCEHNYPVEEGADNIIDWRFSNIDDIINIKIKED